MKLDQAKTIYLSSGFSRVEVYSKVIPFFEGYKHVYIVQFEPTLNSMGAAKTWALESQRGGIRQFKTIDSALKVIKDIGFPDAFVKFI